MIQLLRNEITGIPLTVRRVKKVITDLSENALQVHMNPDSLDLLVEKQRAYFKPLGKGLLFIVGAFFLLLLNPPQQTAAVVLFIIGAVYIFFAL